MPQQVKKYRVNEIFYSLQGEGARTGSANVFVRFAGCNLACNVDEHGFDCDTNFSGGLDYTADVLVDAIKHADKYNCKSIIWTGGEPSLQLTSELLQALPEYYHCVETNGTKQLPSEVNWISCSPKSAEHTLRVGDVDELRYVIAPNMAIPKPKLKADHHYLSPAFEPSETLTAEAFKWVNKLCKEHPKWKMSLQTHKLMIRQR